MSGPPKSTVKALALDGAQMNFSELKVGDRVLISTSASNGRYAPIVGRFATVTAIRALSFDAGGLCFRKDGTEWTGSYRVHLIFPKDRERSVDSLTRTDEANRRESTGAYRSPNEILRDPGR